MKENGRKETPEEMIARCEREGFTGKTLIHWKQGEARRITQEDSWDVPQEDDEVVDLTEDRERA